MASADAVLRRCLAGAGDRLVLTLDPVFQGLPGAAHGGSVLAAFDALASLAGPRAVRGSYRRRVPLGVPLALATDRAAGMLRCAVTEDGTTLVEGDVAALGAGAGPRGDSGPALPGAAAHPLPISSACLACGRDNPVGLRVQLVFDDAVVGGAWRPRETFDAQGALAPLALTTLLDEAAFWLGALASGESGMTTDLVVVLHGPVASGATIQVGGRRDRVRPRAGDARYWQTEVAAWDDAGRPVAEASITFVAVRGAARRLVHGMLAINPPEVVRRVFPAYAR